MRQIDCPCFWAIRHIPSGMYLLEYGFRMGRGITHKEPEKPDPLRPRLFLSEKHAKNTLSQWLRGKHEAIMGGESDDLSGRWITYQEGVGVTPVNSRKREEMEIIPVYLSIKE